MSFRNQIAPNLRGIALYRLRMLVLALLLPSAMWAAWRIGGETGGVLAALGASFVLLTLGLTLNFPRATRVQADHLGRDQVIERLDACFARADQKGPSFACLVIQFDNAATVLDRHGRAAQIQVLQACADRLARVCRAEDMLARLEGGGFALCVATARRLDLDTLVQFAIRLQAAIAEPVGVGPARLFVTASVGFCLGAKSPQATGAALLDAAQIAADEALRNGPGALRAFAADMARLRADRDARRAELQVALDHGQIRAHFQPQISADTGEVTGFETLTRWYHPVRGIIPPADFLTAITEAGLSERLSEVMLHEALVALSRWDRAGLQVPSVGVNFSNDELRNPRLADRLKWELDRFEMSPARLSIEILEHVVSTADNDVIVRNVAELSRMGCRIDLDDFGTGHTSITNIRRFAVHRLKIDRSFVSGVDQDLEQKRVVAAILSMAERLGLDTLAEGVETLAEQATLAQLGCGHLQGYGIARPMPFDETITYLERHRTVQQERLRAQPRLGQGPARKSP
jgi:diguanylate cyclase